jgi:hypothetical protein
MNTDNDFLHQPHPTQQKLTSSFKPLKPLALFVAVLLIALTAGTGGYLLGIRTNQNASQSTQRVSFQPLPTHAWSAPLPTSTQVGDLPQTEGCRPGHWCDPSNRLPATPAWKIYRNERLGFEFKYDEGIYAMEETVDKVSFGFTYPVLTISTNQITDYKSYRPCEYSDENNIQILPCLESGERWGQKGDIIKTTLGQVSAKSFYIAETYPTDAYPHTYYHIVQTTGSPKIEAKMHIANSAPETFDSAFKQMLSTFKMLDNM